MRTSPPKVRQVLGLIRGEDVEHARETLELLERTAAEPVLKLLDSAVANAESRLAIPEDELFVEQAYADEGPSLRRWRPRARGRATRINKRTSHVTIVVGRLSDEELLRREEQEDVEGAGRRRRGLRRRRVEAQAEAEADEVTEPEEPEEPAAEEEAEEEASADDDDSDADADADEESAEGGS